MRRNCRLVAALGPLVLAILATGCSTPIGIRIADPREVQRYLTRSALTEDVPSDFSLNELRRYDLLETYEREGSPYFATARLWDDGVIDPLDTRRILAMGIEAALNAPVPDTRFGVFRM